MATATSPKIAVIFYSLYGHTNTMAETAVKAAKDDGAEATLYQVPETLSEDVLSALHAAPRRTDVPTIDPKDLVNFDGYIFVIPTRYGRSVAQFSHFFDHTGGLWAKQSLAGKFATIMTSTGTQNGGQETTAFTTLPFLIHHGIIHVPHGYATAPQTSLNELKGGSPWGAGTVAAADGSRQPSVLELEEVASHAKHFVGVVTQFKRGGAEPKAAKESKAAAPVQEEHKAGAPAKEETEKTEKTSETLAPPGTETATAVSAHNTGTTSTSTGQGASTTDAPSTSASGAAGESTPVSKKRTSVFKKIKEAIKPKK
ncbi:hypothetical protein FRB94_002744 [Tulasnella sp. JGI-2019a]|nr:hypothetical protein FRB94_002744 [Tulasnella sp. JGI-2019a]